MTVSYVTVLSKKCTVWNVWTVYGMRKILQSRMEAFTKMHILTSKNEWEVSESVCVCVCVCVYLYVQRLVCLLDNTVSGSCHSWKGKLAKV